MQDEVVSIRFSNVGTSVLPQVDGDPRNFGLMPGQSLGLLLAFLVAFQLELKHRIVERVEKSGGLEIVDPGKIAAGA